MKIVQMTKTDLDELRKMFRHKISDAIKDEARVHFGDGQIARVFILKTSALAELIIENMDRITEDMYVKRVHELAKKNQ